jgi:hypothetical protein
MSTLEHVIYTSEAVVSFSERELRQLLLRARTKNIALNLTGMLLHVGRSFFQILEGEPPAVEELFDVIRRDPRHRRVVKLIHEPIERREFSDRRMGLARVTSIELATLPGMQDFIAGGRTLHGLGEGMARRVLEQFQTGRWRSRVGD